MNFHLQIDHIVLHGIPLSPSQRRQLEGAIATELTHLLTENGIPPHLQNGGAIPQLPIHLPTTPSHSPTQMGQHIAQSIAQTLYGAREVEIESWTC